MRRPLMRTPQAILSDKVYRSVSLAEINKAAPRERDGLIGITR